MTEYTPSTRPWRTLVVFMSREDDTYLVRLPGWAGRETVKVSVADVPFTPVLPEYRCHARVNIGCEDAKRLVFSDWEPTWVDMLHHR